MAIDDETLEALRHAVVAVKSSAPSPIPADILKPLMKIARPGQTVRMDIEASRLIGAPLITVERPADLGTLLAPLTARQREVALLIIEGSSNRTIAHNLGISLATVKDHVHAILDRLGVSSRTALVAAACLNKS